MGSSEKSKKSRSKSSKSRPVSTSIISQPVVEDASHDLSSFSPKGDFFVYVSLAVGKHRVRVYDTATSQAVAEHTIETARITALTWSCLDDYRAQEDEVSSSPKKKRKKRNSISMENEAPPTTKVQVAVLGQSDGTLLFFSPSHGRIIQTLSSTPSSASILSVVSSQHNNRTYIWTSSADNYIRCWDPVEKSVAGSWKHDDRIPFSAVSVPSETASDGYVQLLAAHHSIQLLSLKWDMTDISDHKKKPQQLASFTGHATPIKQLQWDLSQQPQTRFVSVAEGDRLVYIWKVPDSTGDTPAEGRILASIPLDSDARLVSLASSEPSGSDVQTILTLAASGKISVFTVPARLASSAPQKLSTLHPQSNITVPSKGARTVEAAFVPGQPGRIRIARLAGGVRPVFDIVQYLDDAGDFVQEITLANVKADLATKSSLVSITRRYTESAMVVGSGVEINQDPEMDGLDTRVTDGDLDVDIAELSLGQRLTALSGGDAPVRSASPSDSDDIAPMPSKKSSSKQAVDISTVVPAKSLTRSLIQALHSSDSTLLETCLAHSDAILIRNTVRSLPPQLAVPLINACVDRLNRGARGGNMKGRGGGASSQRGTALITWVKTVLTIHSGHLMTMPDLIARLSSLHATLTTRLALHESLLSLSGKLDMVLSQIEMRSSTAPAPLAVNKDNKTPNGQIKEVRQYVEGESDEENEQDVEMDNGSEAGSIEDVELGGESEEEEAELTDDSDDEDDDDEEGPTLNAFIDDEAEQDDEEEDEDEDDSGSE